MKMGEYLKKKRVLLVGTFILIGLIVIISVFTLLKKGLDRNKVQEEDIKVTYNLNKDSIAPMDKETGSNEAGISTIIIKNNKNYKQDYILTVKPKDNSTLELNKVYIKINDEIKLLSELNDGEIVSGTINPNEEKTISFKTWIGKDLIIEPDDNDKILNLKYEVIKK